MEEQTYSRVVQDPEPERYYDWMLWKLRQEDSYTKSRMKTITREEMWMKEVAEMQKTNHQLMIRIKEQAEQIQKLKEKIDADL